MEVLCLVHDTHPEEGASCCGRRRFILSELSQGPYADKTWGALALGHIGGHLRSINVLGDSKAANALQSKLPLHTCRT